LFKVLGTTLEKNQKELLQHFEAALDYDREVKEFRKAILTNKFEYGLNSMKLKGLPPTTDLYLMEEESTYKFFNFLVESFSTKEPELDKYCFKASLFYPLKKDFHFELFKILLQFLTDNQESLEQLDFDQFPTLYENKNIEFSSGDQTKQLCVSYKLYDESYRIQSKTEIEQESDSVIDSANINFVLPNEVLSSNVILFVLTGKNKTDRQRFEPIFNAINNRQSIEKVSVVFMQLIETKQDKSKRRLKKDEMIQLFSLEELYEKGLRPYFIRIPYTEVTEQANGHFYFKGIDHFLQDKFTTIVNQSLQDKISVKLPSFFTLKDLAEKVRNSLEDLDNLEIDYESSGMEVKAKLFHEMMSTNSIESYFYVKNFLNHAVESIKLNFDYWYHNLDEIPQEFLENFNQKAFDKIKNAKQEFDEILEVMFKFNDFDEKYTQKIRAKVTKPFNSSLVYELISRKIQKVFMSRKREFNLQELSDFLLTDFKYNSALGVGGNWKGLFKLVYKYYIQFLDDLQPLSILLDEDFKITIDIDVLYKDVENDLLSYNQWMQGLDIGGFNFHFDEPLLEKRSYDTFSASSAPENSFIIIENQQTILQEPDISNVAAGVNEEAIGSIRKSKKQTNLPIVEKSLSSWNFDWDFDKQFQIMKKIHLEDEFFTI